MYLREMHKDATRTTKPPIKSSSKANLQEKQIRQDPGAARALDTLLKSGCDRETLLFFLRARTPTVRAWTTFQKWIAPAPKDLRGLARRLANVAQELESSTTKTVYLPMIAMREESLTLARQIHHLSGKLNRHAGGIILRVSRRWSSYRQMGKFFPIALVCNYVITQTGKPHHREIADLLSATEAKDMAEDTVRHRAKRAIAKLTFKGRNTRILSALSTLFRPLS